MENFQDRGVWIRIQSSNFMDPDPVCPERMDSDPVNIRPDPQPCSSAGLTSFNVVFYAYVIVRNKRLRSFKIVNIKKSAFSSRYKRIL